MYVNPGPVSSLANTTAKPAPDAATAAQLAGLGAQVGAAISQQAADAAPSVAEDGIKLGSKIKAALDGLLDAQPDLDTMAVPDLPEMHAMTNTKSAQQTSASGRTRGG